MLIKIKPKFQPVQLTNPITGKPIPKATIALAPNVFVFDPSLVSKMREPLPERVTTVLNNLKAQQSNNDLENSFEDTLSDAFRMLELDDLATSDDDFDMDNPD